MLSIETCILNCDVSGSERKILYENLLLVLAMSYRFVRCEVSGTGRLGTFIVGLL